MDQKTTKKIADWWDSYARSFFNHPTMDEVIRLKYHHTLRVAGESDRICKTLHLPEHDKNLAHAIAILHDTGRFPQAAMYNTINDRESEDHAALGLKAINESGVLDEIEPSSAAILRIAVANHNRLAIEGGLDPNTLFYCRLIRDADKLDILAVFLEMEENGTDETRMKAYLGLPEKDSFSNSVVSQFEKGALINYRDLQSRHDMRMAAIAWVYCLNFKPALSRVAEQRFIERFQQNLPRDARIQQAIEKVVLYRDEILSGRRSLVPEPAGSAKMAG